MDGTHQIKSRGLTGTAEGVRRQLVVGDQILGIDQLGLAEVRGEVPGAGERSGPHPTLSPQSSHTHCGELTMVTLCDMSHCFHLKTQ